VQLGHGARRLARGLEQLAPARRAGRRDRVVGARGPRACHVEEPGREVAGVDQLQRRVGRSWGDDVAAARQPPQPPRQPPDVLVRTDDHARARVQDAAGQRRLERALARGLERPVLALGPPMDGRGLVDRRGGPVAVGRAGGHEAVVADRVREQLRGGADVLGLEAAGVDHRVPLAAAQRREVARAVAQQVLRLREQVRAVDAAMEERDRVPARERLGDHGAAEEDGAADDEQAHVEQSPHGAPAQATRPSPAR